MNESHRITRAKTELLFKSGRPGDISKPETWPPGTLMRFRNEVHTGLGLVVANRNGVIIVIWDEKCRDPVCTYRCEQLNPKTISREI